MFEPTATRLLAHERLSRPATLGIAAADAGKNGASDTDARKPIPSNAAG